MAAFELCLSIRKEFLKKKVSGEIAFELISLFHVLVQEPASRSTTTRAFVFLTKFAEFYYHKIFETGSLWRPKRWLIYNWRYKKHYFTYFYIMLNDFINCPAFADIKQTLHYRTE